MIDLPRFYNITFYYKCFYQSIAILTNINIELMGKTSIRKGTDAYPAPPVVTPMLTTHIRVWSVTIRNSIIDQRTKTINGFK